MATTCIADTTVTVGFEWDDFASGFVFWQQSAPEHLPSDAEAGQREWQRMHL